MTRIERTILVIDPGRANTGWGIAVSYTHLVMDITDEIAEALDE